MTQSAKTSLPNLLIMKKRCSRIVITGMGALTPIGNSLDTIWQNLTQGVSGISRLDGFEDKSVAIDGFRARSLDWLRILMPKII